MHQELLKYDLIFGNQNDITIYQWVTYEQKSKRSVSLPKMTKLLFLNNNIKTSKAMSMLLKTAIFITSIGSQIF
jgi:hypothetical protein